MEHPDGLRDDGTRSQLEDFLAIVGHEVKTPLAIVHTAVVMLANLESSPKPQPGKRGELLAMIQRNVDLAMLLMDRMGLAHQVEDGTVTLSTQTLDLVTLVRESVSDLRYTTLNGHPVELVTVDLLFVDVDPTAAREMVFNLLANAAKYSAADAPISITLDRDRDTARLAIRDRGRGVTPGDSEHVFTKFFQVDASSKGVGLGLFISRGLARAHGGDISIRPVTGAGTEFVLELPAVATA